MDCPDFSLREDIYDAGSFIEKATARASEQGATQAGRTGRRIVRLAPKAFLIQNSFAGSFTEGQAPGSGDRRHSRP